MSNTLFENESLNAIIVGNGAIGSALVTQLLQHKHLRTLVVLQRNDDVTVEDARVKRVSLDALDPDSIAQAGETLRQYLDRAHLVINTVGLLHSEQQQPEKRLRHIDSENLLRAFTVNAALLPALAQATSHLLRHDEPSMFASLSARVGSIEDNTMGGWYSYRASKAAHNMLLRTIAQEWRISHRKTIVVALHPGTVESRLSQPFISPNYSKTVHTPDECAKHLLSVMRGLAPESTGRFFDWQGEPIPW